MIFNTVSDDSSIIKNYQAAMGISGNKDLPALVSEGIVSKTSKETVAGKPYEVYTINKDVLNQKASTLSKSLINDPQNYNYANSIFQDKLGSSVSLKEALGKKGADNKYENQETVLNQIREYYVDQAIEASGLNKAVSVQLPKPEKADKYESDKDLVTLSRNIGTEVPVKGVNYKIVGDKENKSKLYIQASRKTTTLNKEGTIIPSYEYDEINQIPLYIYNEKTKKYSLNYGAFRTLTGSIGRKQ